jgi:hypothetical protein
MAGQPARARIGIERRDHVPAGEFNRVRAPVMAEFLGDDPEETSAPANDTAPAEQRPAENGRHAQHWR